jgi:hydrogenase nickel incorporation protein HypB
MCTTCGCSEETSRIENLEIDLLSKNDHLAGHVRARLESKGITAFNLLGSPGAGKTTLLERLVRDLRASRPVSVIEGDQATDRDAARIREAGAPVIQINTGAGCHLDAHMITHALDTLSPEPRSLLFVENVGNLVCPALFDLGERRKVLVMSVTEGEDKPLKYPHMFRAADALVLSKTDLLPHVPFDVDRWLEAARAVRPGVAVFPVSVLRDEGVGALSAWLLEEARR